MRKEREKNKGDRRVKCATYQCGSCLRPNQLDRSDVAPIVIDFPTFVCAKTRDALPAGKKTRQSHPKVRLGSNIYLTRLRYLYLTDVSAVQSCTLPTGFSIFMAAK